MTLTRRLFVLGGAALPGCTAISRLNDAAMPLDTYELQPLNLAPGTRRTSRTLLVLEPAAPATIATDRMLIKPDPLSVTYLPGVRWSDGVPPMVQSILIRSLAASGGFGFVGAQGSGPVPDFVLLTRIDAFGVNVLPDRTFEAQLAWELTVLRDRDQRVLGSRIFAEKRPIASDQAADISVAFQQLMNLILPDAVAWVAARG